MARFRAATCETSLPFLRELGKSSARLSDAVPRSSNFIATSDSALAAFAYGTHGFLAANLHPVASQVPT